MEDLIEQLQTKAGLTTDQAHKTIEVMKDYIMGKVPPMFSGFVDSFFAKNTPDKEVDPLA